MEPRFNAIIFILPAFFLFSASNAQSIDDVRKECLGIGVVNKVRLLVSSFHVSAPTAESGMSNELPQKLIQELSLVNCFDVNRSVSDFIPGGTQAIITGNLKDYYTSENVIGKPRISVDLEIRNATTQELIATRNIKITGKLYLGVGNNKSLVNIWKQCAEETVIFLYQNLKTISLLAGAKEQKEKVLDTSLSFQARIKTKSVWDQQKEYADDKRAKDHRLNLELSDYYNDSIVYKEYPKKPGDQFLEYTINGKNYVFLYSASDIKKQASFHAFEGVGFSKHGVKIKVEPVTLTKQLTIDMFYPNAYPKARRFHFGNDTTYDSRISSAREKVTFEIHLGATFKETALMMHYTPAEMYDLIASNDPALAGKVNVAGGYIQVLQLETGQYGVMEIVFKLNTKPYTDAAGKSIPATKIEGRFRCRGLFPTHKGYGS